MNEYEYIDTSPTNLYHNPFHGHPQADQEVAGLQVTPYGRGNGIEVTPILRDADPDVPQWSQPILSNNDFGWSEPKVTLLFSLPNPKTNPIHQPPVTHQ